MWQYSIRYASDVVNLSNINNQSADNVALALLRQFPQKNLPKASELQWLISEHDVPQTVSITVAF